MKLLDGISLFLDSVGEGYSQTARVRYGNIQCSYATVYALCLMHVLGRNGHISHKLLDLGRRERSGLIEEERELLGSRHDNEYTKYHLSSIYYQLIEAYLPSHGPIEAFTSLTPDLLRYDLAQRNATQAWRVSNVLMSYGTLLAYNERRGKNSGCLDVCISFLDSIQNRNSCLWESSRGAYLLNSVAATFHYLPLYAYSSKTVCGAEKVLASVLSMSLPNGHFSSPLGYVCIDYDGIATAKFLYEKCLSTAQRKLYRSKIVRIATKLKESILRQQNPDGGFPEILVNIPLAPAVGNAVLSFLSHRSPLTFAWNIKSILRNSGLLSGEMCANSVKACVSLAGESNTFATWFRYMTLMVCEDILEKEGWIETRITNSETHFSLPGLGYL